MRFTNEELELQRVANELHDMRRDRDELLIAFDMAEVRLDFLKRMFANELRIVFGDCDLDEAIDYAIELEEQRDTFPVIE